MWHWQLLPRDVNLLTLGRSFARAMLLPSLRDLVMHCVPSHVNTPSCLDTVVKLAERERTHGTKPRQKAQPLEEEQLARLRTDHRTVVCGCRRSRPPTAMGRVHCGWDRKCSCTSMTNRTA